MEPDKNKESKKNETSGREKSGSWVKKAEDWMDETAEKIHESEAYQKADKSLEEATRKLFRKAGRWWGKL